MKKVIWRDAAGGIINIGPWDYDMVSEPIVAEGGEKIAEFVARGGETKGRRPDDAEEDAGAPIPAEPGEVVKKRTAEAGDVIGFVDTVRNPPPAGARQEEAEVIADADGGLRAVGDYVGQRRAAYPPLADQLDAIWKGGDDAEQMRQRVLKVKKDHPKAAG